MSASWYLPLQLRSVSKLRYCRSLILKCSLNEFRCSAKFLWKRIHPEEKASNPLLGQLWNVGQKLWQKDHNEVFNLLLETQWPPLVESYMKHLEEKYRQRSLHLMSKAYLSINTATFASLTGYVNRPDEAERLLVSLQEQGWVLDNANQLIIPKQSLAQQVPSMRNEDQLQTLTQFVAFLEN